MVGLPVPQGSMFEVPAGLVMVWLVTRFFVPVPESPLAVEEEEEEEEDTDALPSPSSPCSITAEMVAEYEAEEE